MEVRTGYKWADVGVIPQEWDDVLLDRIARRGSGHTPDKTHPEYWNGSIRWVSLADSPALDKVYIEDTFAKITPQGIANSSAVLHPAGTVVLSRDAGVGKSAILRTEMAVSQHFMAWRCGPELHNIYLYYWLQAAKPQFEQIANGSTIKTIGLPYFKALRIPKPPIVEQRAIAEALGDMDAMLMVLERLIGKKRDLKRAAMRQLLTGKTRLPGFHGEWDSKAIGAFADCTAGGTPSTLISNYWGGTIRWMNSGELHLKRVDEVVGRITDEGLRNSSAKLLPRKCVLIGLAGQGKTRGTVAINLIELCTNQSIGAVLPSASFVPEYLYYNLDSRYDELRDRSSGDGGRGGLNLAIIKAVHVPLPNVAEQTAIAAVLSDMDAELIAIEARRDKFLLLKHAMMQELLTGRTRLV